MPAGRPKKPTHLKQLAGNPGKRPLPENEPQPQVGIPVPPDWLSLEARAEWDRLVRDIAPGVLTVDCRAALTQCCTSWARYVEAEKAIAEQGAVVEVVTTRRDRAGGELETKHLKPNPWIKIGRDALATALRIQTEFGLTPASRTRIDAHVEKPGGSSLKIFQASKHA